MAATKSAHEPRLSIKMMGACHGCMHHRELPSTTHLACRHPATERAHQNPLAGLITAMGGALPLPSPPGLTVRMHPHGIRNSWASWPWNFDPTWLVECDGYAPEAEAA